MSKHKYIETPEKMWELFLEYVEHEKENPIYKRDYVGKDGKEVDTPLQVPITFEGFENHLAINGIINDLGDYSKNKEERYSEYAPILTRIRNFCFSQNFKGASVNVFNPALIAKKLGLIERKEIDKRNSVNIPKLPDIGTRS